MSPKPLRAFVVLFAVLILAVFAQSYNGRRAVVFSQRVGCHRGVIDRTVNAAAWYAAYQAREQTALASRDPKTQRLNFAAARVYWSAAWSLNRRVDRPHSLVVNGRHPVGFGRLDCAKAFPAASPFQFFS